MHVHTLYVLSISCYIQHVYPWCSSVLSVAVMGVCTSMTSVDRNVCSRSVSCTTPPTHWLVAMYLLCSQIPAHEDHANALCCSRENPSIMYSGGDDGLCRVRWEMPTDRGEGHVCTFSLDVDLGSKRNRREKGQSSWFVCRTQRWTHLH